MVAALERAAGNGTTTDSYNIFGFGHLVVKPLESRGHLVGNSAGTHN